MIKVIDKETFLKEYKLQEEFEHSGLEWKNLEEIYKDYKNKYDTLVLVSKDIKEYIMNLEEKKGELNNIGITTIHTISSRVKEPKHLIEKIIRKRGKEQSKKYDGINANNYCEIIRDLIGVRILVVSKEDWESVFDYLVNDRFSNVIQEDKSMVEPPIAYTRYGDRDIFKSKIKTEHSNKGYRSQHYIVKFEGYYCEIQVRTLAEEVYGEFDHRVKYPYREDNKFLKRYTSSVSQMLDSVDEMISTCFQLGEIGWQQCKEHCEEDSYIDWKNTYNSPIKDSKQEEENKQQVVTEQIDVKSYANRFLFRKKG